MENATKALLIAGGILLALITLSIFVYSYNQLNLFQNMEQESKDIQLIQKYNTEFEAFNKKIMYGTEVISALNKAISHNETKNVQYGNEYFINVVVYVKEIKYGTDKNPKSIIDQTYSIKQDNVEDILNDKNGSDTTSLFYNFKTSKFKCKSINYNDAGRISEIIFEQIIVETRTY